MPKQRSLKLESFNDLLTELSTIENQYQNQTVTTTGNWSFYQILDHLTKSIVASIQGYPKMMPATIRRTLGPKALKHILKTGKMKAGAKNPDAPQKREEGDEKKALAELRQSIQDFRSHKGDYAEHAFFGPINPEDYEKLHSIHAALHLGFVQLKVDSISENPIQANPIETNPIQANPIQANSINEKPIPANSIKANPTKSAKTDSKVSKITTKTAAKKSTKKALEKAANPKGSATISEKTTKKAIDKNPKTLNKEATPKPAKKIAKKEVTS